MAIVNKNTDKMVAKMAGVDAIGEMIAKALAADVAANAAAHGVDDLIDVTVTKGQIDHYVNLEADEAGLAYAIEFGRKEGMDRSGRRQGGTDGLHLLSDAVQRAQRRAK